MTSVIRYILDTDHISLAQRGHPQVSARILATPPEQIAITIVSVQEQMQGRLAQIQQIGDSAALIAAYRNLHQTLRFHRTVNVVDFDHEASQVFAAFQKQKLRVGTLDLRIAAITVASQATLVTRNIRDFQHVPDLVLVDWSASI